MEQDKLLLDLVSDLQKLRGSVPTYLLASDIDGTTLIKVRRHLMKRPHGEEIDVILNSPGGDGGHAYRLIRTFREHYDTVNIIVPWWAKSAATIFAFGGNRIVLNEFGELGPLDTQVKKNDEDGLDEGYASALNVQSSLQQIEERARVGVIEMFKTISADKDVRISKKQLFEMLLIQSSQFYEPLLQKIDTMEIGVMSRYLDIGSMYARRILQAYANITDEKLKDLLDFLVYGSPDHGYVIDYNILHPYLDSVIKSTDEPFGEKYDEVLNELSIWLMLSSLERVGFIDDFQETTSKNDKIVEEGKSNESSTQETTSKPKRVNGKPDSRGDKKELGKDKAKRPTKPSKDTTSEPAAPDAAN